LIFFAVHWWSVDHEFGKLCPTETCSQVHEMNTRRLLLGIRLLPEEAEVYYFLLCGCLPHFTEIYSKRQGAQASRRRTLTVPPQRKGWRNSDAYSGVILSCRLTLRRRLQIYILRIENARNGLDPIDYSLCASFT
jgi:hypothetical protein